MIKRFCDRCKKEVIIPKNDNIFSSRTIKVTGYLEDGEICPKCFRAFKRFMKEEFA